MIVKQLSSQIGETKVTRPNGFTPSELAMRGHADKMSKLANNNEPEHDKYSFEDRGQSIEHHIHQYRLHKAAADAHMATALHIQRRDHGDYLEPDNEGGHNHHEYMANSHLEMAKAKHAHNAELLGEHATPVRESKTITSFHPSVEQLSYQISEDIDSVELVHQILGEKILARLEDKKQEVMRSILGEATGVAGRKEFEHLTSKDFDAEFHSAMV